MLTLEIRGQMITWPKDFALLMMRYYRNHGIPFKVYRNGAGLGTDFPPGVKTFDSRFP